MYILQAFISQGL